MAKLPDQTYLNCRIDYNPETGEARWKRVDASFGANWKQFNKLYSGQIVPNRATIDRVQFYKAQILYKLYYGTEAKLVKFANGDVSDYSINNLIDTLDVPAKLDATPTTPTKISYKSIHPDVLTLLRYDHISGDLIWKPRDNKSWNARHANKTVGWINRGYRRLRVTLDSTSYLYMCHRVAWYLYYRADPGNFQIDHIDGDKSNNSITNLRLADHSFNIQARIKNKQFARSQDNNKFPAHFHYRGKKIHLGTFETQEEANIVYNQALEKYKPIYEFSSTEQALLDELYRTYPHVDTSLQHQCHDLQVKAIYTNLNWRRQTKNIQRAMVKR